MTDKLTRDLMRQRADADDDQVEAILDLGSAFAVYGAEIMRAAGRLKMLYETEQVPDPLLDLTPARSALKALDAALKRYDQSVIARGRAAMGRDQSAKDGDEFPEGDA